MTRKEWFTVVKVASVSTRSGRACERSDDGGRGATHTGIDLFRDDISSDTQPASSCDSAEHDHDCNGIVRSPSAHSARTLKVSNSRHRHLTGRRAPLAVPKRANSNKTTSNTRRNRSRDARKGRKTNRGKNGPVVDCFSDIDDSSGSDSSVPRSKSVCAMNKKGEGKFFDGFINMFLATRDGGRSSEEEIDDVFPEIFI